MNTIGSNFHPVPIPRRRFLHAAGVALAAPLLDSILPGSSRANVTAPSDPVPPYALRFTTPGNVDPGHKMIVIFMQGGVSNVDTFDHKANSPFQRIGTDSPNINFTDIMQPLARYAGNFLIINNMRSNEAFHDEGAALAFTTRRNVTGAQFAASAVHQNPFIDFAELLNRRASGEVGYAVLHQSTLDSYGYNRRWRQPWGALKHDNPLTVYSAYDTSTGRLTNPFGNSINISAQRFDERLQLLNAFDRQGEVLIGDSVERHNRSYRQARSLFNGPIRNSFNLDQEPLVIRDRYGNTEIGKELLLARRMIESGVRLVVASTGNYDHHVDIKNNMKLMFPSFVQALAALIEDIKVRFNSENEKVFIAIVTEFGRTPNLNSGIPFLGAPQGEPGRDHWPNAFGMQIICNDPDEIGAGRTIGRTDASGHIVGNSFPSWATADTLLNLMKIGRYERRGEVITGVRFPYIDVINGRLASSG